MLPIGPKSYSQPISGPPPVASQPVVVLTGDLSAIDAETVTLPLVPASSNYLESQAKKRLTPISRTVLPILDDALGGIFPDEILLAIAENDEIPNQELFLDEHRPRLKSILNSADTGTQEAQKHILRQAFAQKKISLLFSIGYSGYGKNLKVMLFEVASEKTEFSAVLASMKKTVANFDYALKKRDPWTAVCDMFRKTSSREERAMLLRVALNHAGYDDGRSTVAVLNGYSINMVLEGQDLSGLKRHMGLDFSLFKLAGADLSDGIFGEESTPYAPGKIPACRFSGDLAGIKFIHSNCQKGYFSGNLTGANMTNADLSDAIFGSEAATKMPAVNLTGAKMNRTKCHNVNMTGVVMTGNVVANDAEFNGSNLSLANMTGMIAGKAKFHSANLSEAVMKNVEVVEAQFTKADLSYADMRGANISAAKVDGAILKGVDLRGANVAGVALWRCQSWEGMIVDDAMLNTVDWYSRQALVRAIAKGEVILAPAQSQTGANRKEPS